jgi:hypothetical protein
MVLPNKCWKAGPNLFDWHNFAIIAASTVLLHRGIAAREMCHFIRFVSH